MLSMYINAHDMFPQDHNTLFTVFAVHADDLSLPPCIQDHSGEFIAVHTTAVKTLAPSLEIQTARTVMSVDHDRWLGVLDQWLRFSTVVITVVQAVP